MINKADGVGGNSAVARLPDVEMILIIGAKCYVATPKTSGSMPGIN
jgi:hypothetical protein